MDLFVYKFSFFPKFFVHNKKKHPATRLQSANTNAFHHTPVSGKFFTLVSFPFATHFPEKRKEEKLRENSCSSSVNRSEFMKCSKFMPEEVLVSVSQKSLVKLLEEFFFFLFFVEKSAKIMENCGK